MPALVVLASMIALGCDGATPNVVPIAGGGVRGSFDGQVVISVVDGDDDPIEGAEIFAGDALLGETGADGSLTATEDAGTYTAVLADGRAVTVDAPGAGEVTIPFFDDPAPSATVTATVPGFDTIQFDGLYLVARAGFTATVGVDAPENAIVQADDAQLDCTSDDTSCTVSLATRVGEVRVFVAISEGFDDAGTPDDRSDDRLEPLALAVSELQTLTGGDEVSVSLSVLDAADLAPVDITSPAPPIGIDAVIGVPGARVGNDVFIWPAELGGRAAVPREVDGTSATNWVIARASSADATSISITRNVTFDGGPVEAAAMPDPPANVEVRDQAVRASIAAGEGPHLVRYDVVGDAGRIVWTGYQLSDATEMLAPPASLALPSTGAARVTVSSHDQDGDVAFRIVEQTFARRASRTAAFTTCPWSECR
jgi:hypothetical protein